MQNPWWRVWGEAPHRLTPLLWKYSNGHIVLDGDPATLPQRGTAPMFGPRLLWPNGRPSQLLLSTCCSLPTTTRHNTQPAKRRKISAEPNLNQPADWPNPWTIVLQPSMGRVISTSQGEVAQSSAAGKVTVGLTSHRPCVTDSVAAYIHLRAQWPPKGEWGYPAYIAAIGVWHSLSLPSSLI